MNFFKTISRTVLLSVAFVALPVFAQDKMVDALPIDKKLRALDSVSIIRLQAKEQLEDAVLADLYPSWTNDFVNYGKANVDKYNIDLRGFHMPCDSRVVTSHYGYRRRFGRMHYGTDIKVYVGDTIRSTFNGKVRVVKDQGRRKGYGKYVIIRHPNGLETLYAHLSKHLVKNDQEVKAGEPIGLGGNTGFSFGAHLHFETRFLGEKIDPEKIFSFEARDVKADYFVYQSSGRHFLLDGHGSKAENDKAIEVAMAKAEESHKFQEERRQRASRTQIHKVRRGDTLSKIAKRYNTTVEKLCRLNNISRSKTLTLGQIIKCS